MEYKGWEWWMVKRDGDHLPIEKQISNYNGLRLRRLRLEPVSWRSFLKALLGLPGYIYYSAKAYRLQLTLQRGLDKWRQRVAYRWLLLKYRHSENPCNIVLTASLLLPK